jgi:ABC-type Fe3+/spermidine/putrescine transport system ATPase subunit
MALTVDVVVERPDFRFAIATSFAPGITCVLGPSGAGKSTLLGAISGSCARPAAGGAGRRGVGRHARGLHVAIEARHAAYLFQSLALFPHLSALHNVAYAVPRTVPRAERHARALALLAKLGVATWPPPPTHLLGRRGPAVALAGRWR